MKKASIGWLVILCCVLYPAAVPTSSFADARDEAAALAAERQSGLEALARTTPDNTTIPGYQGTSVPQGGYTADTLAAPEEVAKGKTLDEAEAAVLASPDPVTLDPDKYSGAFGVQDNPEAHFDLDRLLSGSYEDCTPEITPSSESSTHRCDAWRQTGNKTCTIDRRIDVEANLRYQCDEDSTRIHKTCERVLTKQCGRTGVCNTAGLRLESLESDYGAHIQSDGLILIGKAGSRTWCGDSCTTRTRNVRFTVNNRSAVRTFRVVNGGFDDWLHIKLNGHIVWVGHGDKSNGGIRVDHYEYENCGWTGGRDGGYECWTSRYRAVFQDHGRIGYCERSTHHSIPSLDLKPYLREGRNHLEVRIISTGCGDGYLRLQAQSSCCNEWRESWSETCN